MTREGDYSILLYYSLCGTPYLPLAINEPLVGGEFLETHRATWTKFLGRDAYLGTKTELGTIRKPMTLEEVYAAKDGLTPGPSL